jgi:hypothetical protein
MSRTTQRLAGEARAELRHRSAHHSDPLRGVAVRTDHLLSLLDDADELDAARDVARRLLAAAPAAAVERWEGDEFVVVVDGLGAVGCTMDLREAERVAAWFRAVVAEVRFRGPEVQP